MHKRTCSTVLVLCLAFTGVGFAAEGESPTVLDSITVTATRGEHALSEVPSTVTTIESERIEDLLMQDIRDLVRYEPGVYVDNSASRLGLGGFNIRGIGGNRVLTRIDGVPAAESFEFGHFDVMPFTLGLDSVERVEILRGAASSLYGSDALGGVVSFQTRDPLDLLTPDGSAYLGVHLNQDSRYSQSTASATTAAGRERWQFLGTVNYAAGKERDNQGTDDSLGSSRTAPNEQENDSLGFLAKAVLQRSDSQRFELSLETFDRDNETNVLSAIGQTNLGAIFGFPPNVTYLVDTSSSTARDEQARRRLSLESATTGGWVDSALWRAWAQTSDTSQETVDLRATTLEGGPFGPLRTTEVQRDGLLTFEQETIGVEYEAHEEFGDRQLLTFGATINVDRFDQLRNRSETNLATGTTGPPADGLTYPTKYFPRSRVTEAGLFAQLEWSTAGGRVTLTPGLRYDQLDLSIDKDDRVFLEGNEGTLAPVEIDEGSLSPKLGVVGSITDHLTLHGQYAHGFRAPPYSAVNSGFTHLAGGLTRLPNPDLRPEESDGLEVGLRGSWTSGSFSLTLYDNEYDDFIELMVLGFNPATGLIEFQQRNITEARIHGLEIGGDLRMGDRWYLRGSLAIAEGEDRTLDQPLNSIHPPTLALGLRRSAPELAWSFELATRIADAKDRADLDDTAITQFATPAFEVFDLFAGRALTSRLSLQAAFLNLTDEVYWEWPDALGQRQSSPVLDRYTAPGRNLSISLRYRR